MRQQVTNWRVLGCAVVALGLTVVACSNRGSESAPEVTSRVVEDQLDGPTSSDTTTTTVTTASSTTTESFTDDEAQVLELVRLFYVDAKERPDRSKGPDDYPDVYSEIAIDPVLARFQESDAERIALGRTQESYPSLYDVTGLEVGADEATVGSCFLARDATYESSGELAVSSTNDFINATFTVVKLDDRWWITEWLIGQDDERNCDPVEYWGDLPEAGAAVDVDGDAAEAVAGFEAYLDGTGFFDERTQTLADIEPAFEAYATRHEPFWLRDFYNRFIDDETQDLVAEGWDLDVREVRVDGETVQILTCGQGVGRLLEPGDGSLIQEESGSRWFVAYMLREGDGVWRVEFFWKNNRESC